MRTTLSPLLLRATYAQDSAEVLLPLVKLTHPSWSQPIRHVPNNEPIVHRGETFVPHAFEISLPNDSEGGVPVIQWTADAVDQSLVQKIRAVTDKITAKVVWVLASQPDVIDVEYADLEITAAEYDALQVTGPISVEPILDEPFGHMKFTPSTAPGLF